MLRAWPPRCRQKTEEDGLGSQVCCRTHSGHARRDEGERAENVQMQQDSEKGVRPLEQSQRKTE